MNEELQSTNEELETSKEELQSLNEELTTVNAQLEEKVTDLERTTTTWITCYRAPTSRPCFSTVSFGSSATRRPPPACSI